MRGVLTHAGFSKMAFFVERRVKLSLNNKEMSFAGSRGLSDFVSALISSSQSLFQLLLSFVGRFVKQNKVPNNSAKAKVGRSNLKKIVNLDCRIAYSNEITCNDITWSEYS